MNSPSRDITQILNDVHSGDEDAKSELLELAYDQLKRLAGTMMRSEREGHTLQPTALVNEAAIKLFGEIPKIASRDRAYFFGAMTTAMRRVLIDHARARNAARRGGGQWVKENLDSVLDAVEQESNVDLVTLDDALNKLEELNPRQSQVVSLRFFGGLSMPEIAKQLDSSLSTIEKDWRVARAWLHSQLGGE